MGGGCLCRCGIGLHMYCEQALVYWLGPPCAGALLGGLLYMCVCVWGGGAVCVCVGCERGEGGDTKGRLVGGVGGGAGVMYCAQALVY